MPNPYRIVALGVIAACSLGAVSVMSPAGMPAPDPATAPTLGVLYAAPVERVETHVLASGQTLMGVLGEARITGPDMADLLLSLRSHVNPRRLGRNAEVTVRRWARTDEPRAVDIRVDADSTVRLVKQDLGGWSSEVLITPTEIDTVFAGGVIGNGRTSLYEAIVMDEESRLPPRERVQLVYTLATIYEYKLDFTREIQPGDSYKLVYEREARPDGSARSRRVLAASMNVQGREYPAIWFDGSSDVKGYFDLEARPLATGFSRYPVAYPRITSNFNPNRYHPVLGVYRAHAGTDFGAPTGTEVHSTANGTVTFAGTNGGYGRMIEIRHFNGFTTRYAHLSAFAPGIRLGAKVTQKQLIGRVGATGLATAPHLHYELRINGRAVNARTANLPDAPPIPGAMKSEFMALAAARSTLLDRIPAGSQFYAEARSMPTRVSGL
jgi:murein DD-endopeptidase MepM/ murein hydrolase activator NlpD